MFKWKNEKFLHQRNKILPDQWSGIPHLKSFDIKNFNKTQPLKQSEVRNRDKSNNMYQYVSSTTAQILIMFGKLIVFWFKHLSSKK